jgi:ATP-binding cassette subfamily B protein
MSVIDKLPEIIEVKLTEKPLFHAVSDLMMDGRFGEQWIVLTEKEVTVWGPDGELVSKLMVADMTDVRAVGGIGGGSLLADTKEGPVVLISYTASLTSIFGFAAKLFGAVAKG